MVRFQKSQQQQQQRTRPAPANASRRVITGPSAVVLPAAPAPAAPTSLSERFAMVAAQRREANVKTATAQSAGNRFAAQMSRRTGAPASQDAIRSVMNPKNTKPGKVAKPSAAQRPSVLSRLGGRVAPVASPKKKQTQQQKQTQLNQQQKPKQKQGQSSQNQQQKTQKQNQKQQPQQQQKKKPGNAGRGGRQGARAGNKKQPLTQDQLDAELEKYMLKDQDYAAKKLDEDLDNYFKDASEDVEMAADDDVVIL